MIRFITLSLVASLLFAADPALAQTVRLSHIPNDPPTTLAFRVLKEAYRRIGIEAEEVLLPHERSLRSANSGETDGEVMRIEGMEATFPDLVRVPEPVQTFDTYAYTTGLSFTVDGWESLKPYSLCINRGMKLAEQGTEGMNRLLGTTAEQTIEMLFRGRCQVGLFGPTAWLEFDRLKLGPFRQLKPTVSRLNLYHYVNKRHQALVARLAEALRQMRKDGTFEAIFAEDDRSVAEARKRTETKD